MKKVRYDLIYSWPPALTQKAQGIGGKAARPLARYAFSLFTIFSLLLLGALANAQTIGVNFVGGNGNNPQPSPMGAAEVAGVVPISNWNNLVPANGGAVSTGPLAVHDSTGAATAVTVDVEGVPNTWSGGIADTPGNNRLMNGYLDSNTNPSVTMITVAGLSASTTYNVYVYAAGDNVGATATAGAYTIGSQTFYNHSYQFDGNFVQSGSTDMNNPSTGNYMVFTVTGQTTFTMSSMEINFRDPVNGIEIVPVTTAPAAPTGVAAVAHDGSVTLSWTGTPNAVSYNVLRGTTAGGPYSPIATSLASTGYSDATVTNGTTYHYVVQAINTVGTSPNSSEASATPAAGIDGTGLTGNYFDDTGDSAGNPLFDPNTLIFTEVDPTVNFDFINGPMPTGGQPNGGVNFSAQWTGLIKAQVTGPYVFSCGSDDGSRIYLDGQLLVNNYFFQGVTYRFSAPITLQAGSLHVLRVNYFQGGGGAAMYLDWSYPGQPTQIIPQYALYPTFGATPPPAPVATTAYGPSGSIVVNWTTIDNATSYTVSRSTTAGGPYTQIATGITNTTTDTTSYTDATVTVGTTYYYVVDVKNANGTARSNETSIKAIGGFNGTGLTGNYYQNAALNSDNNGNPLFLPGDLVGTEIDPVINFDFVANPNPFLIYGTNNFAVKWTGLIQAPVTGTYTFSTASDDGSDLFIDGQLIVNNYAYQGVTTKSGTINLVAGSFHTIRVQYYQGGGGAAVSASWAYPGQGTQLIPTYVMFPTYGTVAPNPPVLTGLPGAQSAVLNWTQPDNATSYTVYRSLTSGGPYTQVATGVTGGTYTDTGLTNGTTYYYVVTATNSNGTSANSNEVGIAPTPPVIGNGIGLAGFYYLWNPDTDFAAENDPLTAFALAPTVNFVGNGNTGNDNPQPFPAGAPVTTFTAVYSGQLLAPFTGSYTFQTNSDDGIRVTVNSQLVINDANDHGPTIDTTLGDGLTALNLVAGQKYDIKVEYWNNGGGSSCQLYYNPLGSGAVIIPTSQLFPVFPSAPDPVTDLTAVGGSHLVNLAWSTSLYATSFNVLRSTTTGGPYTMIASGITTPGYTDLSVTNGTTYYYVVQALNYIGTSANSNEASATPAAAALVLQYTFEDGPSGTDPDPIKDFSGSGNDGYAVGGDMDFIPDAEQGVWAGLTTNATAYLALPDAFDFGSQFTFFCYTKLADITNIQTILGTNGSGGSTPGFALYVNDVNTDDHALVFETNNNASGTNIQTKAHSAPGAFPLGDGKYHAVAAVVNAAGGTVSLYIDGVQVLNNGVIDNTWPTASGANRLGLFPSGDEIAANSQFDDVRVYNGLLSPSDIAAFSSASVSGRIQLEGVNDLTTLSAGAPLGTFHVEFRTPSTLTDVFTKDVTLTAVGAGSPFGTFSITGVPPGTYDVAIKGSKNLRVVLPSVSVSGSTTLSDVLLPAGDADNNNAVDIGDFGVLVNAFGGDFTIAGSGYDPTADFNFDGHDDIADFGLLVNEFGNTGAP